MKAFGESLGDFGKTIFGSADTAAGFGGALSNLLNQLDADDMKRFAGIFTSVDFKKLMKDGTVDMKGIVTDLTSDKTKEAFSNFLEGVEGKIKPPGFNPTTGEATQFGRFRVINRETTARTRENLGDMAEDAISGLTSGVVAFLRKLQDLGVDLPKDALDALNKLAVKNK